MDMPAEIIDIDFKDDEENGSIQVGLWETHIT
jgi:hypothetical protein